MTEDDFRRKPDVQFRLTEEQSALIESACQSSRSKGKGMLLGYSTRFPFPDHGQKAAFLWFVDFEELKTTLQAGRVARKRAKRKTARSG